MKNMNEETCFERNKRLELEAIQRDLKKRKLNGEFTSINKENEKELSKLLK